MNSGTFTTLALSMTAQLALAKSRCQVSGIQRDTGEFAATSLQNNVSQCAVGADGLLTFDSSINRSRASLAHFRFIAGSGKPSHEILT